MVHLMEVIPLKNIFKLHFTRKLKFFFCIIIFQWLSIHAWVIGLLIKIIFSRLPIQKNREKMKNIVAFYETEMMIYILEHL